MTTRIFDPNAPDFARRAVNLADSRLGAEALSASDEFFAPKERLLYPEPASFVPGKYDDHGKWMDGWETRRKRAPGCDWCIIKLARPGVIWGVDVDTSHFTGNYPPAASIEACHVASGDPDAQTRWTEILPATALRANSHHYLSISSTQVHTHVRLNLHPDGGVARLRVYGCPHIDWTAATGGSLVDFAAMENGSYIVFANDEHFGPASSLLMPGRGANIGDGWETRRRREPGNGWCIISLARPGVIRKVEIDTAHFKGNYPDRCSLHAAFVKACAGGSLVTDSMFWPLLLPSRSFGWTRSTSMNRKFAPWDV